MPDMREEFEASGITRRISRSTEPGCTDLYEDSHTQMAWMAWQASRAALRVELPECRDPLNSTGDDENPRSAGFNDCLERVTEALQQAGIEVKHGTA